MIICLSLAVSDYSEGWVGFQIHATKKTRLSNRSGLQIPTNAPRDLTPTHNEHSRQLGKMKFITANGILETHYAECMKLLLVCKSGFHDHLSLSRIIGL